MSKRKPLLRFVLGLAVTALAMLGVVAIRRAASRVGQPEAGAEKASLSQEALLKARADAIPRKREAEGHKPGANAEAVFSEGRNPDNYCRSRVLPAARLPRDRSPRRGDACGEERLGGVERRRPFGRLLAAHRTEQGHVSRSPQSVPLRRSPVRRERPRDGDGHRADLHPEQLRSLRRGGGRRRLADRQGAHGLELGVHLRQLRDQRHRCAADRSERSVRQHDLCRHRRAERLGRFGSGRRHLQDDGRRHDLDAGSRKRHLLPARRSGRWRSTTLATCSCRLRAPCAESARSRAAPSSSGNAAHPLVSRGLYRQTAPRSRRSVVAPGSTRGSTTVRVDPTHAGIIYVNEFSRGIWRSVDNGATWTQIFDAGTTPRTTSTRLEIDEFDVTTLPNGNDADVRRRRHVPAGRRESFRRSGGPTTRIPPRRSPRSADAQTSTTARDSAGTTTRLHAPGAPDVVYVGGSFSYGQLHGPSNGRAWLLSTDGGSDFQRPDTGRRS